MTLHRKKISLIHIAKSRLALDDDVYRDILRHVAGVDSSRDLDDIGFELVMEYFARLGFESDWRRRTWGERPGMATPRQVEYIRQLWHDYTDGEGTDITLGKWLSRTFKVSALRFVTAVIAPKAITALLSMNRKRSANAAAPEARTA